MGKNKKKKLLISLVGFFLILVASVYTYLPQMLADEVYPLKYTEWIVSYSTKYSVDPALVSAVIFQESRFNPNAKSSAGAQGLMQFMPGTAATMAKATGRWPKYNIFDPETSIEFGAAHLRDLLLKYNGDLDRALAGYNAGTGTVDRWDRQNVFSKIINSNSKGETVSYVRKVKNYQSVYAAMYAKELGLEPSSQLQAQDPKELESQVRGFVWSQLFNNVFSLD